MRNRIHSLWILLLATFAGAQQPVSYTAQQYQLLLQNPPQMVAGATVQRTGNPGSSTFYYWIVAKTLVGNATPAGPFQATLAPNSLNGSNFLTISWSAPSNATSYDVLRTLTPAMPAGACACAVATAVSALTTTDQSNSLSAYTVNTLDPNTLTMALTNEGTSAGSSTFTLRVNGVVTPLVGAGVGIKTCQITLGADGASASPLTTDQIQPQFSICKVEANSTISAVIVMANAGASTVQVSSRHLSVATPIAGPVLPVSVGGIAPDKVVCANSAGTAITIEGTSVTCGVLTNTALTAGDWIETTGGAADGTTKRISIAITYTPN